MDIETNQPQQPAESAQTAPEAAPQTAPEAAQNAPEKATSAQTEQNTLLGGAQKEASIPSKPEDGDASGGGKNEENGYEFTLPEGFSFSGAQKDAYASLAAELKLAPEAAQKMLTYGAEQIKTALKKQEEASVAEFDRTVAEWGEETKKRLGGPDGDGWREKLGKAKKALDAFATDGFKTLLGARSGGGLGLGNHPELVQTFLNVAEAVGEDSYVNRRKSGGAAALSDEEILYPNQTGNK